MDLTPLCSVLTFDCSYIYCITSVYGFLGSTINQSINQCSIITSVRTQLWRKISEDVHSQLYFTSVAYAGIFSSGGGRQKFFRWSTNSVEDRENGDLEAAAP
jgi:hypothetical protein